MYTLISIIPFTAFLLPIKSGAHLLVTFTVWLVVGATLWESGPALAEAFPSFALSRFHLDFTIFSPSLRCRENRNRLTQIMLLKSLLQV